MKKIAFAMAAVIAIMTSATAQYVAQYDENNPAVIKTQAVIDEVYGKYVLGATYNAELLEVAQSEGALDRERLIYIVNEDNKMSSRISYQPKNTTSESIAPNVSKTTSKVFDFYGIKKGQSIEEACLVAGKIFKYQSQVMNGTCYKITQASREEKITQKNGKISILKIEGEELVAIGLPNSPDPLKTFILANMSTLSKTPIVTFGFQDEKYEKYMDTVQDFSLTLDYLIWVVEGDSMRLEINFQDTSEMAEPNKGINKLKKENPTSNTGMSTKCESAKNKMLMAVVNKSDNVTAEQAVIDFTSTEVGLLAVLRASECDGDPQDSTDKIMMGILKQKEIDGTIKATKAKWIVDMMASGQ